MADTERKLRVFLCHASQDKPVVRELYQRLKAEGWIDPWLDEEKLYPGQDWDLEIEKAVEAADAVIIFLSSNSVSKEGYVQAEMRMILRMAMYKPEGVVFLIPLRLDDCVVPFRLRSWQYVDYFPEDRKDWAYQRLLSSLRARTKKLDIPAVNPVEEQARLEAEEKARKEKEERERKEREEKARKEKEAREKAEAEERARIVAEQKAKKEREEQERRAAEEKARKEILEREKKILREKEVAEKRKKREEKWMKIFAYLRAHSTTATIALLLIAGVGLLYWLLPMISSTFDGLRLQQTTFTPISSTPVSTALPSPVISTRSPTPTNETNALPSPVIPLMPPTATSVSSTLPTPVIPLMTLTATSVSSTLPTPLIVTQPTEPALGIGSTMTSEKDGMVMVYVPAGEFRMGSVDGDNDEQPVHTVALNSFWIDQTEVTNGMYAYCVARGECSPPSLTKSSTRESYYGDPEFSAYPVIYVSWNDAKTYCEWVDRRLPTEAEWEKSASWDGNRYEKNIYPWGNEFDTCELANLKGCENDTTMVGSYKEGQSSYGTYDMGGNVWEWVADWYDAGYYASSPLSNPMGPNLGTARVLRGSSWHLNFFHVIRSAKRYWKTPDSIGDNIGFRCAMDASE
ncbi:MAG: SUMF1/EgtB/PvdO family nonheme iron enzyme [Chloroflexota bacterium]